MGTLPPTQMDLDAQNTTEAAPPQSENWVFAHPFTATLAAAAVLLIFGTTIVISHSAASPVIPGITAWGGDGNTAIDPTNTVAGTVTANQGDTLQPAQDTNTYTIPDLKGNVPPPPAQNTNDSFSYAKFMAGLAAKTSTGTPQSAVPDISYAFPPTNLFTVPTPTTARSDVQQALYNYGNEIGSYMQSYDQQHPDQAQTLKNQIEDQSDPDKIQAVIKMGHDLEGVGNSLLAMEDVPPQVTAAHIKLAQDYQIIGKNLALVPLAHGNDALLNAINTYNASANVFAKDFVSLVSFFSMYGVTFSADDAGSVFTFTYTGEM